MMTAARMLQNSRHLAHRCLLPRFLVSCTSLLTDDCLILTNAPIVSKRHAELARQRGHTAIKLDKADERRLIKLQAIARGRADRLKLQKKVG